VLSANTFEIPELQRPYAWRVRQVEDFINDIARLLVTLRGNGDGQSGYPAEHLFGTIVVLTPTNVGGRVSVIDGQQRLTTVSMTLGLIEAEMRRLREQVVAAGGPQADAIAAHLLDSANRIHERLWLQGVDLNQPPVLRLLTSPEIREAYEAVVRGEQLRLIQRNSAPAQLLLDAAERIQERLIDHPEFFRAQEVVQKQRHLDWLKNTVLEQLLFVLISTPSNAAAYDLFEVLNARGEQLNELDLLKTWIMSTMAEDPRRNAVFAKLSRLVEDPEKQLDYLDDFYRARVFESIGEDQPIVRAQKVRSKLFHESEHDRSLLGSRSGSLPHIRDEIVEQVDLMSEWYPKWIKLNESKWPFDQPSATGQQSLEALQEVLGCRIARPLLLQAAARLCPEDFETLLHMVEKTFFRYKTICSRQIGPLEAVFYKIIEYMDHFNRLNLDFAAEELQRLLDERASESMFEIGLDEFSYQPGSKARRIKYFLWTLDRYAANPAPAPIVIELDHFEIEHVAPQRPRGGNTPVPNVDTLGNLCILTDSENVELSNLDFPEKLTKVNKWRENQTFITAKLSKQIFDNHSSWGEAQIQVRTTDLKERACKAFRTVDLD